MVLAALRIASSRRFACGCRAQTYFKKRRLNPELRAEFQPGLFRRRELRFAREPQDSIHKNAVNAVHGLDSAARMCHGEPADSAAVVRLALLFAWRRSRRARRPAFVRRSHKCGNLN